MLDWIDKHRGRRARPGVLLGRNTGVSCPCRGGATRHMCDANG